MEDEYDDILAICWGLVAIDPYHNPFLRLLNSALAWTPHLPTCAQPSCCIATCSR
jgi:hypothetical protein